MINNPYNVDYVDHRKSFYGYHNDFDHGWSFHASFHFGHSFFNPWHYGYSPFFTYYYWYPYYNYGRSYYYSDYPYYASPQNNYYYDEYYPVYNNYYGEGYEGGSEPASNYEPAKEETTNETLVDFYLRLGDIHFKRGEYAQAVDAFKKAVQEDPSAAVPKFALGEALFATGDYHYGAYNLRKGLDRAPNWVEQTIDRREYYGNGDDFKIHLDLVRTYIAEHPFDAAAQFCLGYNAFFSKDLETATQAFQRAQEIEPGDRYSKLFLDQIALLKTLAPKELAPATPAEAPNKKKTDA